MKTARHHDRLARAENYIDWERFRPIKQSNYDNKGLIGSRSNLVPVMMVKLLSLG